MDPVLAMLRQVGGLAESVSFERSFRLGPGRLDRDRLLLGVDRPAGTADLDDTICRACADLGMPQDQLHDFRHHLPQANHVYFGAERAGASLTLKGYLEFRDAIAQALRGAPAGPAAFPLFTGYKWAATGRPLQAVAQYLWQPGLSAAGIMQRLQQLAADSPDAVLWRFISHCAERALQRLPPQDLQFVEVREAGHPRASVDINVYRMGWCVDELRPWLDGAVQHFGLPAEDTTRFLARVGGERLGHVAGGVDRQGRGFLTLYHGGTRIAGRRLQTARLATPDPAGGP